MGDARANGRAKREHRPRPKGVAGYTRAALAYADLEQQDAAEALNISVSTLNRWLAKGAPAERLADLAQLCEVPVDFFEVGFWPEPADASARRTRQLERQMARLASRIAALEEGRKTLTSEQSDFILDELLGGGATAAPASSPEGGRGRQGAAG